MRKLINKKGFSLVELMIVVVIMGILVAVAIPLYTAITENAEKKTCQSNQALMREMFAKYCVMDGNHDSSTLLKGETRVTTKDGDTTGLDSIFVDSFSEEFPGCSLEGHYFVFSVVPNDKYSIKIECYDADDVRDEKHSN